MSREHLVQRINDNNSLGVWVSLEATSTVEAAGMFLAANPEVRRVIVRGPTREVLYVYSPEGPTTRDEWTFERGGPMLCKRHCIECTADHHLCDAWAETHVGEPDHEAAKRGVVGWLPCKHCDAWFEYDYGDGLPDAIEESHSQVTGASPAAMPPPTQQFTLPGVDDDKANGR